MSESDATSAQPIASEMMSGGDPIPHPQPVPHPAPGPSAPPSQPAGYTFRLVSMQVLNTRSAHEDSDKVGFSVAVGSGAAKTLTKDMGNVNNGTFPIGLTIGPMFRSAIRTSASP